MIVSGVLTRRGAWILCMIGSIAMCSCNYYRLLWWVGSADEFGIVVGRRGGSGIGHAERHRREFAGQPVPSFRSGADALEVLQIQTFNCSLAEDQPTHAASNRTPHQRLAHHRYETPVEEHWRTYIVQEPGSFESNDNASATIVVVAGAVLDLYALDTLLWNNKKTTVHVFSADAPYYHHPRACRQMLQLEPRLITYHMDLSSDEHDLSLSLDDVATHLGWWSDMSRNRTDHPLHHHSRRQVLLLQMGSTDDPNKALDGAAQLLANGEIQHVIWRVSTRNAAVAESSHRALTTLFEAGYELVGQDDNGGGQLKAVPWLDESLRVQQLLHSAAAQFDTNQELSVWFQYHPKSSNLRGPAATTLVPSSHPPPQTIDARPLHCPKYVADARAGRRTFHDPNENIDPTKSQALVRRPGNSSFRMSLHVPRIDPDNWPIMTQGKHPNAPLERALETILQAKPIDPRVIDVGSHVGYFSLLAASLGARVDAFEPHDASNLRLCESLALNNNNNNNNRTAGISSRIKIHPLGVSDRNLLLHYIPASYLPEQSHFALPKSEAYADREILPMKPVVALDHFAHRQGWLGDDGAARTLSPLQILKVSAPGMEDKVLAGSRYLLQHQLVKNVLFVISTNSPREEAAGRTAATLLLQSGYQLAGYGGRHGSWRGPPFARSSAADSFSDSSSSREDIDSSDPIASQLVREARRQPLHQLTVWFQPATKQS